MNNQLTKNTVIVELDLMEFQDKIDELASNLKRTIENYQDEEDSEAKSAMKQLYHTLKTVAGPHGIQFWYIPKFFLDFILHTYREEDLPNLELLIKINEVLKIPMVKYQ